MKRHLEGQVVLLIGATGGLGGAIAEAIAGAGARLILTGRSPAALEALRQRFPAPHRVHAADIADVQSITSLVEFVQENCPRLDLVINAAGTDVRKPLEDHTPQEVHDLVNANLLGAIHLTRVFMPVMRAQDSGMILHVGGFADGRLAFPYYSVDAATRAGLATFVEAVNRELRLAKSRARVGFFSPSPADTPAERPFHPIWRDMGLVVETPQRVAAALLDAAAARRQRAWMGGIAAGIFARLNAAFPSLADRLMMDSYGRILRRHLVSSAPAECPPIKRPWTRWLGIGLVAASFLCWAFIGLTPLLPLRPAEKLAAVPVLVLLGELLFWPGGILLGKEFIQRYKAWFSPAAWFRKVRK